MNRDFVFVSLFPEKVTFSREKVTFSREKVVFTILKVTFSALKVILLHINIRIIIHCKLIKGLEKWRRLQKKFESFAVFSLFLYFCGDFVHLMLLQRGSGCTDVTYTVDETDKQQ